MVDYYKEKKMARKLSKRKNLKAWKAGINNVKVANSANYAKDTRKGIRF